MSCAGGPVEYRGLRHRGLTRKDLCRLSEVILCLGGFEILFFTIHQCLTRRELSRIVSGLVLARVYRLVGKEAVVFQSSSGLE